MKKHNVLFRMYKNKSVMINPLYDIVLMLIVMIPGLIMWANGVWYGVEDEVIYGFSGLFDYGRFVLISIFYWCFFNTVWQMLGNLYEQFADNLLSHVVFFSVNTFVKFIAWVHVGIYTTIKNNWLYLLPMLLYLLVGFDIIGVIISLLLLYLMVVVTYAFALIVFVLSFFANDGIRLIKSMAVFFVLIGGVYFPLNHLPEYISNLLVLFPFTIGIDIFRYFVLGMPLLYPLEIMLGIVVFQAVSYFVVATIIYRKIEKYVIEEGIDG